MGNKDELISISECLRGYKTMVRGMMKIGENPALRCKVDEEEHLKTYGVERGGRNGNLLFGPLDYANKVETSISGGEAGPARQKKIYR